MCRILTILIPAMAALVVGEGCARRDDPMAQAARDGILHFGNGAEVQDLDAQLVTGFPEHNVLAALGEGLLAEDPVDLHPVPGVAERYDVSADGLTYTFRLRADARWSNGAPLTAEDFYRSYQRMLTPELAAEYANMLYDFVDQAEAYYRGEITDFARVGFRVIDAQTLEIRLKHPTPYFPKILASHYSWFPVPVDVIAKFGGMKKRNSGWTRAENFVGNGPFRLKEWRYKQVLIVERNPYYWDREKVRLNEIWFHPIDNLNTEEAMFRTGQLHWTYVLALPKIDGYRNAHAPELKIAPWLGSYFYRCNTIRPPFNDVRVRRAFALAIDRESLVHQVTRGEEQPADHFTPPGFPGYDPPVHLRGTMDEARALLAAAGYPGGKGLPSIEVLYNTHDGHRQIAEALQQMWRTNLGAAVTLRNEEWSTYLDSQDTLNYSLSRSGWIADFLDPHTFLEIFVTGGGNNDTGWSNAEYDDLRVRALAAKSEEERLAIYTRMEQILVDELPIIPIYHYTTVRLVHQSVQGYHATPLDHHPFKYIWLEMPAASAAAP